MEQSPIIFTGSLFLGRILPILYFLIVIPGLIEFILYLFGIYWRSSKTEIDVYRGKVNNPHSGFYMVNDATARIIGIVLFLLLFALNASLGALTAKLTIINDRIEYQELLYNGWHREKILVSDIRAICKSEGGSYYSAGNSFWIINSRDGKIITERIADQYKFIMTMLDKAKFEKKKDSQCYYNPNLVDERGIETKNSI